MTVGAPEHAMPTQAPDIPLPDPMAAWLRHLESNRRYSPHTLDGYRRELRFLIELAERAKLPLDKLANGHIRQFVARLHAQGRGPRSLARTLAAWPTGTERRLPPLPSTITSASSRLSQPRDSWSAERV